MLASAAERKRSAALWGTIRRRRSMIPSVSRSTVQPGQEAPDFSLPLVSEDGQVALDDYRGRSPLVLALLRSLWCPFCRRRVTQRAS